MLRLTPFVLLVLLLAACQTDPDTSGTDPSVDRTEAPIPLSAVALIEATSGSTVQGQVTFVGVGTSEETRGSVLVRANISGLTPGARHGFHIHAGTSCADDGQAAGGHFSPDDSPHGAPDAMKTERHAGDMGNLEADDEGRATYDAVIPEVTLEGADSVVGHAIIVHAGTDDLTTQPTGDAGGRIGCGIIGASGDATMDAGTE